MSSGANPRHGCSESAACWLVAQLALWRRRHPQGQQDTHGHPTQLSTLCGSECGSPCQQSGCSFGSGEAVVRYAAVRHGLSDTV